MENRALERGEVTVENFKSALLNQDIDSIGLVRRYLIYGEPFVYQESIWKYYELKERIARQFNTHPHNVIMVGSAKLGFSIAPKKNWKVFNEESDIDIVIVSESAFTSFWSKLFLFNENISHEKAEEENYKKFKDYFFRGWIRPDYFSYKYPGKNEWFDFFSSLSRDFGNGRKISGALYYGFDFFEKYHTKNIDELRKRELGI